MKVQIPFQQLLTLVRNLSPKQKAQLRKELSEEKTQVEPEKDQFIDFLINGPVYSKKDIAIIEENRKSIAEWRTKS